MLFDPQWDKSVEPDTNDEWREVLRRAADLIERTGWNQHSSVRHDLDGRVTGYCALGAIDFSGGSQAVKIEAADKLREFLAASDFSTGFMRFVSGWNDSQTDKRVVIDALRQAAMV